MILPHLIFFGLIGLALLGLTTFKTQLLTFFRKRPSKAYPLHSFSNYPHYHEILSRYFQYYAGLNDDGKIKFVNRVAKFINSKSFIGMEKLKVTLEMKVLVSASAIQLTFGLEKYLMNFFKTIKIYPKYFYSNLLHAELKGGASEAGVLMLSWEDFLMGYRYPHDNYNLGLHEMAHVLKINVIKGSDFDEKFSFYLDKWMDIGKNEFQRLRNKNLSLLREYGGTNKHEFFAVCVEHFFENPLSFKEKLPDIYNHLCLLLNQDPTNGTSDYSLKKHFAEDVNKNEKRIPIPNRIKENYKYHDWHWTYSLMLFGIIFGILIIILIASFTIIPVEHLFGVALIGALLAAIVQYRYLVVKNNVFNRFDFALYAVFGIMPTVTSLFLLTNFLVRIETIEENHRFLNVSRQYETVIFNLDDNAYQAYPSVRSMKTSSLPKTFSNTDNTFLKIKFAKGIFGYKYHLENEILIK